MDIARRWCGTCARTASRRLRSARRRWRPIRRETEVRRFAALYDALDSTTSTNAKVAAMQAYFAAAPPADAAWALFFLTGGRLKRLIAPRLIAQWGCERAGVPGWLFGASFGRAGDLAETVPLRHDTARGGRPSPAEDPALGQLIEGGLLPLRGADEAHKRETVLALWDALGGREIFLLDKLLTGELRVG